MGKSTNISHLEAPGGSKSPKKFETESRPLEAVTKSKSAGAPWGAQLGKMGMGDT